MKKNITLSIKMLLTVAAMCFTFSSCEKDSIVETVENPSTRVEEVQSEFSIDKKDLNFTPEKNSSRSIYIKCTGDWKISGVPEWLRVSSYEGTNSVNVEFTTIAPNRSSETLEATIQVSLVATGESQSVTVRQEGSAVANCKVRPGLVTTLSNGIAFDMVCEKNVARYYRGYIKASRAGVMSEDEIIRELESNFTRHLPNEDEVAVFSDLTAATNYIIYTVGYDKYGNRGDLIATEASTLPSRYDAPQAWIGEITGDSRNWYWSITKSATCQSYYMMTTEDAEIAMVPDVLQAWWIDYAIQHDGVTEYLNGGDWEQVRSASLVAVWTRGHDSRNNMSGKIEWLLAVINDTRSSADTATKDSRVKDYSGQKLTPGQCQLYISY